MTQYRDLFVVSSALVTAYGLLPTSERVAQTMATLDSVRERAPHADIVVLELSRERIPFEYQQAFIEHGAKHILHFYQNQHIIHNYQMCSPDVDVVGNAIKNLNEMAGMHAFLEWARGNHYFNGYRRIFKISGRYRLCEPFDAATYDEALFTGRAAFFARTDNHLPIAQSGGIALHYMTRLWSFDPILLPKLEAWFEAMYDMMLKRLQLNGYIDIEHLLALVIPRQHCVHMRRVGVQGIVGFNGAMICE